MEKRARRLVILSTICLIVGVALATDPNWYWQVGGFVLLMFVPASLYDAVRISLRSTP